MTRIMFYLPYCSGLITLQMALRNYAVGIKFWINW